jgi:peptidoglycan/LPS O-acetylase OafA/YrhL
MIISIKRPLASYPTQKFIGLEFIRFICAIAILFWHYQHFDTGYGSSYSQENLSYPFYAIFSLFYNNGLQGVRIFWCISGFIFFWKYRDVIANNLITPWKFFSLRFSRLYPLHALTLILVLCMQAIYFSKNQNYFIYAENTAFQFLLQIFLASNWNYNSSLSFNGPIWSISVEVLIYLIFFITCRFGGKKIYPALLILLITVAINRVLTVKGINIANDLPLVDCAVMFFAGGVSALLTTEAQKSQYRIMLNIIGALSAFLIPVLYWAWLGSGNSHFFLFLLIYLPILFYSISSFNLQLPKNLNRLILSLGNMTYSSYLIHFPIQLLIALICSYLEIQIPLFEGWFFVGYMSLTLFASYFLFVYFEKPAQEILRSRMIAS